MAEYWGTSKPTVMTEDYVQQEALEQLCQEQARNIATVDGLHHSDVLRLHLDYRDIMRIDCLWEFTSLVKLDLNNNLIEKIEGLDSLVNLELLNLSSNSIEIIEGLGCLRKLEVLNLANNRISVIENMDTLEELSHFNIGNNQIEQLDNVLYLGMFKKLFTLNLFGNPVSEDDEYTFFITAHFPHLMFLDYKLLDETTKNEAFIKYHYEIEKMKSKEIQQPKDVEEKQYNEAEIKFHTEAFVEFLNGSYLFKSMLKDGPEEEVLRCVPGVFPLLQTFEDQITMLCTQLFELGLDEHHRRQTEVDSFFAGQMMAVTDSQQKTTQILTRFEEQHKKQLEGLQQLSDAELLTVRIENYKDELKELCNTLMALEFRLVCGLEDIIRKFDTIVSEMVDSFVKTIQGIFAQCRDLEDSFHEKVWENAQLILENVAEDKLETELNDDVKVLFSDRDTVVDALATCHDNHLQKINDRETNMITRVTAWKASLIQGIEDKHIKQNHTRISDIHRCVCEFQEQLEDLH